MILNSDTPYYLQIERIIRARILNRTYAPGSKLPDENTLAAEFDVSKDVIRVSMRRLAENGLVKRIRSRGTFVREETGDQVIRILLTVCQNPFAVEQLRRGIEAGLGERPHEIIVSRVTPHDLVQERRIFSYMHPSSYSMIVATPAIQSNDRDNRDMFQDIINAGTHLITVDHQFTDIPNDALFFDEYGSLKRSAENLLQQPSDGADIIVYNGEYEQHRIDRDRMQALTEIATSMQKVNVFPLRNITSGKYSWVEHFISWVKERKIKPGRIFATSNLYAWEIFQALREEKLNQELSGMTAVCDYIHGDDEFNQQFHGTYRLFDDYTPALEEVVNLRLSGRITPAMSIVRLIKCREMEYEDAQNYFRESIRFNESSDNM